MKLEMLTIERGLPTDLHAFINGLKQRYTMEFAQPGASRSSSTSTRSRI